MDRKQQTMLLCLALVPLSSLLGLSRPMWELNGWTTFAAVWKSNLWGDLVFTAGTAGAAWATLWAGRNLRTAGTPIWQWTLVAPLSFALHWMVYAFSWSFTGNGSDTAAASGQHFWSWTFGHLGNSWSFTFEWGWIGLAFCAVAVPAVGAWLQMRPVLPADEAIFPPPLEAP
jgi:hypothetical protein